MSDVLAQRLRAARQAIAPEITQRDVAKRIGVSFSAVNLWEKGKTEPNAHTLAELAKWYQVSTDWLLGVESTRPVLVKNTDGPTIHNVPVVTPSSLVKWHWDKAIEALQTAMEYPPQTAAAMVVTSDALTSVCPPGCMAVVSKAHPYSNGQIVLAQVGKSSEPVLRKFVQEGSEGLLVADDMRYPSYRMDDGVKIIGRVTEVTIRKQLN